MVQRVTVKWGAAANGDWTDGADWTPSGIPNDTASFDYFAYIGGKYSVGSGAFTVTSSTNETVGLLETGANATFSILGGKFSVDASTRTSSALFNYGHLNVSAGATLSFGDSGSSSSGLWNESVATIAGTLSLSAPYFNLYGVGTLTLSGAVVGVTNVSFINHGGKINGSGSIGQGSSLTFTNTQGGLVDATGAAALTMNTGANEISNHGTIETTANGGLNILSSMNNSSKLIDMGAGALKIAGAEVHGGGSLTISAGAKTVLSAGQISLGGLISIAQGGTLTTTTGDITAVGAANALVGDALVGGDIVDAGKILVADHSLLNLNASVYGTGQLDLNAATAATTLEIFGTGSTLFQSGGVVMSNNAFNSIVGNGAATLLSNDTSITGAGTIGDGWLRVFNSILGKITANGSVALTIKGDVNNVAGGGKENFNAGTITSTGAGGLTFSGGTLSNSGLLVEDGAGAMTFNGASIDSGGGVVHVTVGALTLKGNSKISSQSLVTLAASTTLSTTAGDTADALAVDVTNSGSINVVGDSTLQVSGHWTNYKTIALGSSAASATLSIQAGAKWQLLGVGGRLTMANASDKIVSGGAGASLLNKSDLITGAGTIGDANMLVDNNVGGTIDATLAGGLTLSAMAEASDGTVFLFNDGTIKADTAAGVTITVGMSNDGSLIADSGSKIVLKSNQYGKGGATINGTASIEFGAIGQDDVHFGTGGGRRPDSRSIYCFHGRYFWAQEGR